MERFTRGMAIQLQAAARQEEAELREQRCHSNPNPNPDPDPDPDPDPTQHEKPANVGSILVDFELRPEQACGGDVGEMHGRCREI